MKKTYIRILALLFCTILVLPFAACTVEPTVEPTEATTDEKIETTEETTAEKTETAEESTSEKAETTEDATTDEIDGSSEEATSDISEESDPDEESTAEDSSADDVDDTEETTAGETVTPCDGEHEWKIDASGHWKDACAACSYDGVKKTSHTYSDESKNICTECGYDRIKNMTDLSKSDRYETIANAIVNGEKFLYFTDPHFINAAPNGAYDSSYNYHLDIMGAHMNKVGAGFALSGGDWLNRANTKENAIANLKLINSKMQDAFGNKFYLIVGNHDYNYLTEDSSGETVGAGPEQRLTYAELVSAWYTDKKYGPDGENNKAYYSFMGENTIFYVFDGETDWDHGTVGSITDYDKAQITWFLTQLAARDDAHIALAPHILYNYLGSTALHGGTEKILQYSNIYNNRGKVTFEGTTYDFSGKTGRVEFLIAGHTHKDEASVQHNIPCVLVDEMYGNSYPKFDLIAVDYDARKIYTTRVGVQSASVLATYDRVIDLDVVIPPIESVDVDGYTAADINNALHGSSDKNIDNVKNTAKDGDADYVHYKGTSSWPQTDVIFAATAQDNDGYKSGQKVTALNIGNAKYIVMMVRGSNSPIIYLNGTGIDEKKIFGMTGVTSNWGLVAIDLESILGDDLKADANGDYILETFMFRFRNPRMFSPSTTFDIQYIKFVSSLDEIVKLTGAVSATVITQGGDTYLETNDTHVRVTNISVIGTETSLVKECTGDPEDHMFIVKSTAYGYLATPISADAPAEYYYSCTCGAKGTETFKSGSPLNELVDATKSDRYETIANAITSGEKFLYFSDPHFIPPKADAEYDARYNNYLDIMGAHMNKVGAGFAISGGDWLNRANTKENAIANLKEIDARMQAAFGNKFYMVIGNHDYNYLTEDDKGNTVGSGPEQRLTSAEMVSAWYTDEKYGPDGLNNKTYYSFMGENTRFYVLDGETDWEHLTAGAITDLDKEQITWYLTQLAARDDAHIAIAPHILYSNGTILHGGTEKILEFSNAYNNRESVSYEGVTYDFSEKTGRVEFLIAGHTHKDEVSTFYNIPCILMDEMYNSSYPKFDLIAVDYDARKVYTVRVDGSSATELQKLDRVIELDILSEPVASTDVSSGYDAKAIDEAKFAVSSGENRKTYVTDATNGDYVNFGPGDNKYPQAELIFAASETDKSLYSYAKPESGTNSLNIGKAKYIVMMVKGTSDNYAPLVDINSTGSASRKTFGIYGVKSEWSLVVIDLESILGSDLKADESNNNILETFALRFYNPRTMAPDKDFDIKYIKFASSLEEIATLTGESSATVIAADGGDNMLVKNDDETVVVTNISVSGTVTALEAQSE